MRNVGIAVGCVFLLIVVIVIMNNSVLKKIGRLRLEQQGILNRVQQLDIELRIKDSFLLVAVENSYRKIDELSHLRSMNQKGIDSLTKSIEQDRKSFESLKEDLLSW